MPEWVTYVRRHLTLPELTRAREDEIVEDLARQLEDFYREGVSRGLAAAEAEEFACKQILDWESLKSDIYRMERRSAKSKTERWAESAIVINRGKPTMFSTLFTDVRQDFLYGLRMLTKSPGFTAVAVITLALGIGANAAIFSLVNGILLGPLPYPEPDRLIQLWEANPAKNWTKVSVSVANYLDWKAQSEAFEDMALYDGESFNLTGTGEPERLRGIAASTNLFSLLERTPAQGRGFEPGEDQPGAAPVVILSHGFWERRFGSDPELLGQTISLNGVARTVIGIMHADFVFPSPRTEVWVPFKFTDELVQTRDNHSYAAIGRLAAGVTLQQARTELDTIAMRLEEEYPDGNTGWRVTAITLYDQIFDEDLQVIMGMLFLAVGFVVLIACANVANLLLARAASREKEFGIRLALGAGRLRLIRQLLTESTLLAFLGGVGGILVAYGGIQALRAIAPDGVPQLEQITLNPTVLLYTLSLSLLTGIIFGLVPALQGTRTELQDTLKEGGRGSSGGNRHRWLKGLVVAEIALALVLLALGGLMIRSFQLMQGTDPGFRADNILTMRVSLTTAKYEEDERRALFYQQVQERIRALPGVEGASIINTLPLDGSNSWRSITFEGRPPAKPGESISVGFLVIAPDYFNLMGIPLRQGRKFNQQDVEGSQAVVIINETMAKRHWPEEKQYLGLRFRLGDEEDDNPWLTVVGVAADVRHQGLGRPPRPEMFVPHGQMSYGGMFLLARTSSNPTDFTNAIRSEVWAVDPDQPVYAIRSMEQVVFERMDGELATAQVMGFLALLALVLASVGIYGVVTYSVSERTHEIGIRMALGAQPGDILRLVVRQGFVLVAIGLALGLVGALALTRLMTSILFGVSPSDPTTFITTSLILIAVTVVASIIPARRATRVDPMIALRYE